MRHSSFSFRIGKVSCEAARSRGPSHWPAGPMRSAPRSRVRTVDVPWGSGLSEV